MKLLTDNHHVKVESFTDTLTVPLVGQVGETNVAGQLAANNVLHIGGSLSDGLGVLGADGLSVARAHGVAALNKGRFALAVERQAAGGSIVCWGVGEAKEAVAMVSASSSSS